MIDNCECCNAELKRGKQNKKIRWCKSCVNRKSNYNITYDELTRLLAIENCEICDKKIVGSEKMIDHSHDTGEVRGILCRGCNTALGSLNDDQKNLLKAIEYLKTKQGDDKNSDSSNSRIRSGLTNPVSAAAFTFWVGRIIKYIPWDVIIALI